MSDWTGSGTEAAGAGGTEAGIVATYANLRDRVSYYLGWGPTAPSGTKATLCNDYVKFALGKFYLARRWNFMRPAATLVAWADVAADATITATGTHSGGTTTITASEASFYNSMIGATFTPTGVAALTVGGYTSSTVITATGDHNWSGSKTFTIASAARFALPDTFAHLVEQFRFAPADTMGGPLERDADTIALLRGGKGATDSGRPQYFALVPRSVGVAGDRWDALFYPAYPDTTYTMSYRYEVNPNAPSADTDYAPGATLHSVTMEAMALAVAAEREGMADMGFRQAVSEQLLAASIARDGAAAPRSVGMMQENSDNFDAHWRSLHDPTTLTYNT